MNAKLLTSTSMITGKVALSYPNLLTPSTTEVSKGKFGCNFFLFSEEDKKLISEICNAAYQEALSKTWGGKKPATTEPRVKPVEDDKPHPEGALYTLTCSNGNKPIQTITASKERITDPNSPDIYGGQFARAQIRAFGWEFAGKRGVSISIMAVQILGGGQPLGGGADINAFDDETEPLTNDTPNLNSDLPF